MRKITRFSGQMPDFSRYQFVIDCEDLLDLHLENQIEKIKRLTVENLGTGYVAVVFPEGGHTFEVKHLPMEVAQLRDLPDTRVIDGVTFYKHFNMKELTAWHDERLKTRAWSTS